MVVVDTDQTQALLHDVLELLIAKELGPGLRTYPSGDCWMTEMEDPASLMSCAGKATPQDCIPLFYKRDHPASMPGPAATTDALSQITSQGLLRRLHLLRSMQ